MLTAFLLPLCLLAQTTEPCTLTVRVVDIAMIRGEICVAVYDSATGLKKKKAFRKAVVPVTKQEEQFVVQLPKGEYAVMLVQDLNGNRQMDSFLSLPLEPYGVSNNHGGYPSFQKAKIDLRKDKDIVIQLNN